LPSVCNFIKRSLEARIWGSRWSNYIKHNINFIKQWYIFVVMSPKLGLGDILCLLRILLSPQTKFGDLLFLQRFFLLLLWLPNVVCETYYFCSVSYYYYYYYYYYSTFAQFCPSLFSEMPLSNFMKSCRNIICHVKSLSVDFFKMLPLPWKRPKC
jgi:hypothetical protein